MEKEEQKIAYKDLDLGPNSVQILGKHWIDRTPLKKMSIFILY